MTKPTASEILLDSSAWLAYFLGEYDMNLQVNHEGMLLTSSLSLYEISFKLSKEYSSSKVKTVLEFIKERSLIIETTDLIAEDAARISKECKLVAMDALIYATARHHNAVLVTLDHDFKGLENVQLLPANL